MLFVGATPCRMDEKNRIPLPRDFRDPFNVPGYFTTSRTDKCIALYTQEAFARAAAEIEAEASRNTPEGAEHRRQFYGDARVAKKDTQGRVTIPEELSAFADLKKDVVVVGVGESMEIWDKVAWETRHQARRGG